MTARIFKYPVAVDDVTTIDLPLGAEILTVQSQGDNGIVSLWAKVDDEAPLSPARIRIVGTGHELGEDAGRYISTFQMLNGRLVFHAFEMA